MAICRWHETCFILAMFQSHLEIVMLRMALIFLVLALVAGSLGFGLVANLSIDIARILFFIFLVLFLLALVSGVVRRGGPTDLV